MEIKTEEYTVTYDSVFAAVVCKGSFMLSGTQEYEPILNLLNTAAEQQSVMLTLDLRSLEFLNSSGINTLTKFVINIRKNKKPQLVVVGHEKIAWQVRLLKNLQRLLPDLTARLE